MSLRSALDNAGVRAVVAADAVVEAGHAVRERTGFSGMAAQLGLDTIHRLRPGFLERHIHAMLPDMARALEPHWNAGVAAGDPRAHLEAQADQVAASLLTVSDDYVSGAEDAKATAVYNQLRTRAPHRIAEQMPRIAAFIERHTPTA